MIHVENALDSARQALESGRLEEVERELQGVLDFDEDEPRALRLMGKMARAQGEFQQAAGFFARAWEARASHHRETLRAPPLTPTLAELYAHQGYPEAAAAVYRQLLDREREGPRYGEWRRRLIELEGGREDGLPLEVASGQEEDMDPPEGSAARRPLGETDPGETDAEGAIQRLHPPLGRRRSLAHLGRFLRHLGARISRLR